MEVLPISRFIALCMKESLGPFSALVLFTDMKVLVLESLPAKVFFSFLKS